MNTKSIAERPRRRGEAGWPVYPYLPSAVLSRGHTDERPGTPIPVVPAVGHGSATGHHGEIFQGIVEGRDGHLHRGLVSLPCSLFRSEARFEPDGTGTVSISPPERVKARRAAELALSHLGVGSEGGRLLLTSNMPPKWGFGSSTTDVVAALRAVADSFQAPLSGEQIAALAIEAETASDPAMYGGPAILFAQREGMVLESFGRALPPLEVLGFNADPLRDGVDTLKLRPAEYDWWETEAFRPLIGLLRHAVGTGDVRLVGRVATASARINQRHLPKPNFERLEALVGEAGAIGLQVAHSGTITGLLFDPADPEVERQVDHARTMLVELGIEMSWRFRTDGPG